jgi:transcriptional regulator with XRE-family HTH domain
MYGSLIRQLREARGLSQSEVAATVGIARTNLSAYEQGRRLPSIEMFNRMVVACGSYIRIQAGSEMVDVPLPKAGWFSDEDLPGPDANDPISLDPPLVDAATSLDDRVELIRRVLHRPRQTTS